MEAKGLRIIAFYLPQYHPIPENDEWWGRGFTEWTNVARARPLFPGHYQPHLPADLGFYDLRLAESRHAQATMAASYGIGGFCYYHYWFNGRRLLERPFNDVLASGHPYFPFCLCWANETWSRRWLGEERDILLKQEYSPEDDAKHARWLASAFRDQRYLSVDGRPLFLVYRPRDLPQPERMLDILKAECMRLGVSEPYLVGVDAHCPGYDFRKIGFDTTLVFEPQLAILPDALVDRRRLSRLQRNRKLGIHDASLKIYDYRDARRAMTALRRDFPFIPSVFVGWDNTPRRGEKGVIIVNSTPEAFETALDETLRFTLVTPSTHGLLFINAWNEWAEGNHLEADQKYGLQYLAAVKRASSAARSRSVPA
jgi:hypothetical protein